VRFRVEHDAFGAAVGWGAPVLPIRPAVPVLAGLRLQADCRLAHVTRTIDTLLVSGGWGAATILKKPAPTPFWDGQDQTEGPSGQPPGQVAPDQELGASGVRTEPRG
jgi:hypothetical protein